MVMEGFTALPECSRKAQTTPDRARYWLKLLGVETVKTGNVRYVPNGAVNLLGNMARLISSGMTPGESAKKAKEETPAEIVQVTPAASQDTRLDGIEKAVLAMAEQMKVMVEENRALRSQISTLQKALEYRKPEAMPAAPVSSSLTNPQKEEPPAPIRVNVMEPTQRKVGFWESVELWFGMVLGQG